jgi:NAD-dependent SIR2 family protein deacetylase
MNDPSFFDGNAVAGELRELFSVDLTAAAGQCVTCGKITRFAEARLYAFEPGIVVRCPACEQPLMRLVKSEGCAWLDLRGLVYLQMEIG